VSNTLEPRHYLGSRSVERRCAGFAAALRRATVPPEEVAEHSHIGAHFVLAVDSGYLSAARGAAEPAGPVTLIYNPPGTVHRDRFAETGGRFLSIDVPTPVVPAQASDALLITDAGACASAARIAGLIAGGEPDMVAIEELLLLVVAGVSNGERPSRHVPDWLRRAVEALHDLSNEDTLEIRQVAHMVGVHPVHLARAYRRHFGHGPSEAVRRQRIARATDLLTRGLGLAEVAAAAGFADQSHMTRAFRRDYGVTPARFRDAFV
jgi:AraC family transcriptional regulator